MTTRGLSRWAVHALAGFGVVSLLLQSYQAIWDRPPFPGHGGVLAGAVATGSAVYGILRARPARAVVRELARSRCRIEVMAGDLFDQDDAHLVVGFTDVFDTDVTDDRIIQAASVQGQFLHQVYGDDQVRLDTDLTEALIEVPVIGEFTRREKPFGKVRRYPIGTVAVLGEPRRLYFCVAYSTMAPNLVAQSSTDALWHSLSQLWLAVHQHGQRQPLVMPVVGGTLARVDNLDREALVRLVLLSFVAASRARVLTTDMRIVLRPGEFAQLNRAELQAFLDSL